jgi:hypothetical protein
LTWGANGLTWGAHAFAVCELLRHPTQVTRALKITGRTSLWKFRGVRRTLCMQRRLNLRIATTRLPDVE